ncbi:MAG: hypothetical protein HY720_26190, partial [Planctomycetes bacterium]|nr:hypothetical protein [Planctomycetota bacterium]
GSSPPPDQEHKIFRRQDLPPVYYHDGALVLVRTDLLMDESLDSLGPHAWFGEDRRGLLSPGEPAVEIDSKLDYYLAQAILSHGDHA